jgi:hypothetical protein
MSMIASMSQRLHQLMQQVEQLKAQSGMQRVAEFLASLAPVDHGSCVIALPYDKLLIAARLGLRPPTLSRIFTKLRSVGVTVHASHVAVDDVGKLHRLATDDRSAVRSSFRDVRFNSDSDRQPSKRDPALRANQSRRFEPESGRPIRERKSIPLTIKFLWSSLSRAQPTAMPPHRRCTTDRDLVPWCFSDAGRQSASMASSPAFENPCTKSDLGDDLLSGRLIGLGDVGRLLHGPNSLRPRHQYRRLAGLDGAACGYSHRDCCHTLVVRHIGDENEIIITEAIPTTNQFAPDGLACRTSRGFNSVLRILELRGPRLRRVGYLVHVHRHVRPPLFVDDYQHLEGSFFWLWKLGWASSRPNI